MGRVVEPSRRGATAALFTGSSTFIVTTLERAMFRGPMASRPAKGDRAACFVGWGLVARNRLGPHPTAGGARNRLGPHPPAGDARKRLALGQTAGQLLTPAHRTPAIVRHFQRDTKSGRPGRRLSPPFASRFEHLLHNKRRALIGSLTIAHQHRIDPRHRIRTSPWDTTAHHPARRHPRQEGSGARRYRRHLAQVDRITHPSDESVCDGNGAPVSQPAHGHALGPKSSTQEDRNVIVGRHRITKMGGSR
jgi:hypothetical protein